MSQEWLLCDWLTKARIVIGRHMDRIENFFVLGMPDVEAWWKRWGQFWLQLKAEERLAPSSTPTHFKFRDKPIERINRRWCLALPPHGFCKSALVRSPVYI